jgi:hypothetical protein
MVAICKKCICVYPCFHLKIKGMIRVLNEFGLGKWMRVRQAARPASMSATAKSHAKYFDRASTAPPGRLIELTKGEVWSDVVTKPTTIKALAGVVWITQSGDNNDYVLSRGESLCCNGARVVVQALQGYATFEIEP